MPTKLVDGCSCCSSFKLPYLLPVENEWDLEILNKNFIFAFERVAARLIRGKVVTVKAVPTLAV